MFKSIFLFLARSQTHVHIYRPTQGRVKIQTQFQASGMPTLYSYPLLYTAFQCLLVGK